MWVLSWQDTLASVIRQIHILPTFLKWSWSVNLSLDSSVQPVGRGSWRGRGSCRDKLLPPVCSVSLFFPTYLKCYPSPGKLHPTTWKRMRSEDQDSNTANICQNMGGASRGKKRQRNFKVNSQIISEEDASTFMKKSDKIEKERYWGINSKLECWCQVTQWN